MQGRIGFVPGTYGHAGAAARALLVADPHGRAFLHIAGPPLVSVLHHLIAFTQCPGRAFPRAFLAFCTKVLEAEIDGLIRNQW